MENWDNNEFMTPIDDWYNEEYTGSLAETKIFSAKAASDGGEVPSETVAVPPLVDVSPHPASTQEIMEVWDIVRNKPDGMYNSCFSDQTAQQQMNVQQPLMGGAPMPGVGSLTAAQSQYLSQLTQQTSESVKAQQNNPATG